MIEVRNRRRNGLGDIYFLALTFIEGGLQVRESAIHDTRGARNPLDRFARPLHDLRISVMDRCNFRCPYCMPQDWFPDNHRFLKSQERLSFDEIVRLSRLFAGGLGVRKLRLTGGEPLLRANLAVVFLS
jgi:sulfatase maturation enzyme AslB (radical SAM superfamily)